MVSRACSLPVGPRLSAMNFRFSSRCSFGHATPMNSTMRLVASSRIPQSVSSSGMIPSSSARNVLYRLGSNPWFPLWA